MRKVSRSFHSPLPARLEFEKRIGLAAFGCAHVEKGRHHPTSGLQYSTSNSETMGSLLIATSNPHKRDEIRTLLGNDWKVLDLSAFPQALSPDETGLTFAENAEIKARAASEHFPGLVLADDSGLEVDALDGAPGVISARYAGGKATDADNRRKLLNALADTPSPRSARFRCVICLAEAGELLGTFDGAIEGEIAAAEQGERGFGYDSIFVPRGGKRSFAEITAAEKNALSHRARALEKALAFLRGRAEKAP